MIKNSTLERLQDRISTLENEVTTLKSQKRDFDEIQNSCKQIMLQLTQGATQISLLNEMVKVFQNNDLPFHLCFVSCDQEGGNWRINTGSCLVNELITPSGMMLSVPAQLCYMQFQPNEGIHEVDLSTPELWEIWQPWVCQSGVDRCLVKSICNTEGLVVGFVLVFTNVRYLKSASHTLNFMIDSISNLVYLSFVRDKTEEALLNSTYEDELTGLMQPKRFCSSFSMMMKDARRQFLRIALISVHIHNGKVNWKNADIDDTDIIALAKIMRSSVRSNDLIGRFSQNEFLMGVKIRNLEDAETIALKLLKKIDLNEFQLSETTRVALGVSFYPEHSTYDALFSAATNAAKNNGTENGLRIEYHGRFCHSSADLYDF
ncbi:GGDEF domain-containing protein [Marinomonas sp. 2405UD68-3]|uniref:GGDEF domain-containing protein n=1 Tax=Marinomonas sp. 2405UD68-3 TaxID=3391835 RepID=UPI0039C8E39F